MPLNRQKEAALREIYTSGSVLIDVTSHGLTPLTNAAAQIQRSGVLLIGVELYGEMFMPGIEISEG